MAATGNARQYVLGYLSGRCGFQFNESTDLSPDTRRQIGDLTGGVQGIWALDSQIAQQKVQILKGTPLGGVPAGFGALLLTGFVLGLIFGGPAGLLTILLLGGILFFAVGVAVTQRRKHRIQSAIGRVQQTRNEQWQRWTVRADALSRTILEESKAVYQQKVNPKVVEVKVDFAEIIRAAQGKGVILDMLKCPSCGGSVSMPKSGQLVKCSYCGSEITATSVFDKIKAMLA